MAKKTFGNPYEFLSSAYKEYEFEDKKTKKSIFVQALNKKQAIERALNKMWNEGFPEPTKKNLIFIEKHSWGKLRKVV